jgi:acetoin utilization deacetylase AcuC-like enzyme
MPTAYITDSRFERHNLEGHPEHAGRLRAIQRRMGEAGLLERLTHLEASPATDEDLRAVHSPAYLDRLATTAKQPDGVMFGPDTYVQPESFAIARLAAGAVLRAVDAVMQGAADNAQAAVRPPGHHATTSQGMGFCLLNNVAIAARYVQRVYGVERALIVDYDVHHGNGTEEIFYRDPSVFYLSTHQSPLYPGTGSVYEIGEGAGEGYNLNVPLPPGTGDDGFAQVADAIIGPVVERFRPQIMFVSAGFDAHWSDPLAQLRLTLSGYDRLTRALIEMAAQWCEGRLVFVLEGGYNLPALSLGWSNVTYALLGEPICHDPLGTIGGSEPSVARIVEAVKQVHKLI